MPQLDSTIFAQLQRPHEHSHKGQNGRLLIIAGSEKFHGALLLAVQAASRIVDMVYVYTTKNNRQLVENLKSDVATFIAVRDEDLEQVIDIVDAVVIGPGMETTDEKGNEHVEETRSFVHDLLKSHPQKKFVVAATALWHVDIDCLHTHCILTPHSREFEHVFNLSPSGAQVVEAAKRFGGVVVLKSKTDYISDGTDLWENNTGNIGMTKGGTGDVVAGVIGGLVATNSELTASLAGIHLVGLAGDALYEEKGTFYNAQDVVDSLSFVWKKYVL